VPLGIALDQRSAAFGSVLRRDVFGTGFRLGYVAGLFLFAAGLHWIAFLKPIAVTVKWIMYPAWVAAAAYLALYPAIAAMVAFAARVRAGIPIAIGLPLAWLGAEKLRSLGELSFPWLSIGYTQWEQSAVLQWAAIGGVSLVGAWVVAVNGCVLAAIQGGGRGRAGAALAAIAIVVACVAIGRGPLWPNDADEPRQGARVALIQGNVPGEVKWSGRHQTEVLTGFLEQSREALRESPRLLIWPETATGSYLRRDPVALIRVSQFVDSAGVPLLAGYPDYEFQPDGGYAITNSAGTFLPGASLVAQYDKMHLVPFGERMPFQWLLPALGNLDLGQAEFVPGDSLVLLPWNGEKAAVLVCFESVFPEATRAARRAGATLLVNITNDEWFGRTGALYQHAAMAVFRAVETRLPLARCANTGLTFFVDRAGRVYERGGVFTRESRLGQLDRPGEPPPYVRFGDVTGVVALLATAFLVLRSLTARGARDTVRASSSGDHTSISRTGTS
jgi:apolipoprotein N-acyltransferase